MDPKRALFRTGRGHQRFEAGLRDQMIRAHKVAGGEAGSDPLRGFVSFPNKEDLLVLKELLESKKVTPVIDRTYGLSEVPEALRYFGEGHTRGKVVITVEQTDG